MTFRLWRCFLPRYSRKRSNLPPRERTFCDRIVNLPSEFSNMLSMSWYWQLKSSSNILLVSNIVDRLAESPPLLLDIILGAHHHPQLIGLTYIIIMRLFVEREKFKGRSQPFKFQFCNHILNYLGFAVQWHTGDKHLSKFRRET